MAGLPWPAMAQARAQDRGARPKAGARTSRAQTRASAGEDEGQQGTDDGSAEGRSGGPRVDARESFLVWMARASGPIGIVIAAMSFYLIALVVWMALHYRTPVAIPRGLVREVQDLLEQKKYNEAYHRLVADPSFLARVLAAGVRKLPAGLPQAQRAMEMANEDATMEMEHRTTYLATVGTLGPMIGLVGTVYGMIMAFRVIALEGSIAPGQPARGRDLDGPVRHARGDRRLDSGDLFLRDVPQPDRPAVAGGGDGGRAAAGAVRAGRAAGTTRPRRNLSPRCQCRCLPMGGATAHPHPFAVSAALAAGRGLGSDRARPCRRRRSE